jgi:hypothetical protein
MKKAKWALAAAAFLGVTALTGLAQKAPNLDGTWVGKTDIPGVGTVEMTLVLKRAGTIYSGTISIDHNGTEIQAPTEIRDVTADGEKFSFVFPLTDDSLVLLKLVVAGDQMTGQWEHASGSTGAVELARKGHEAAGLPLSPG